MKWLATLLPILMFIACSSCRTTSIAEPTPAVHDTIYQWRSSHDSIYVHDSIFQVERIKGDTVFVEKDVYRTEYRDRWRTDSIYIAKFDTIVQTVKVEKELSIIQSAEIMLGKLCIYLLMITLLVFIFVVNKKAGS